MTSAMRRMSPSWSWSSSKGATWRRSSRARPQAPGWAAELVETLARAMHYAHQQGIIHRDLKPANILLQSEGTAEDAEARGGKPSGSLPLRPSATTLHASAVKDCTPKITDFGLAKWLEEGFSQTISGELVGTPGYMAPEQARGKSKEVGVWTDVYALGAILYELFTGRPPFVGETRTAVLQQVPIEEPVPPRRLQPGVPRDLETICLKCLEKEPARRYASAEALAEDLRRYRQGEPIRARPAGIRERAIKWARRRPGWAATVVACTLLFGVGLLAWQQWMNRREAEVVANAQQVVANAQRYLALNNEAGQLIANRRRGWAAAALAKIRAACELDFADRDVVQLRTAVAACASSIDLSGPRVILSKFRGCRLAFGPEGDFLAVGRDGGSECYLLALRPALTSRRLSFAASEVVSYGTPGPQDDVRSLAISPDGRWLVVGARSGMVHLWDLEGPSEKPAQSWMAHINQARKRDEDTDEVEAVVFSSDGTSFWSAALFGPERHVRMGR